MIKRYRGNSGQVTWMEEPQTRTEAPRPQAASPPPPLPTAAVPPRLKRGPASLLSFLPQLESGDLLMLLVLYLLYRESGDGELLIMIAALLFS